MSIEADARRTLVMFDGGSWTSGSPCALRRGSGLVLASIAPGDGGWWLRVGGYPRGTYPTLEEAKAAAWEMIIL